MIIMNKAEEQMSLAELLEFARNIRIWLTKFTLWKVIK
ncbi:hypothetical protein HOR18_gp033 [Staphylococcus phage vB_SscM-1]|uniref:Uncharacterized protein n=2 Tax=Sciuriunavirus SscM1 TaxID=2734053 RepID=A0A1X9I9K3_9CAUD|nr:hypothetical protein HOR18_gp033 [Staphylococcus phage vB_SscM-1]ANT44696.1 hypothetical protein vB_SscM-1_033 [Staphylococcus phage vB_SscM-1]ANT44899.1 hypothetical protein vB_SscM-2_032 [Staphylococcus phage vB_SscM-2]